MKTLKEVSEITHMTIRTLRYYDEIGLLKPTQLTDTGYRLYDNKAIEKLLLIMFFRELEIPLMDIKAIMDNSNLDKEHILATQKSLLEKKRNRLNGLIQLISDVKKGVNTMSFETFTESDIQKILDHTLECMSKEDLEDKISEYGSKEKFQEHVSAGFKNEKVSVDLIKWYGSKEKAMEAMLQSTGNNKEQNQHQNQCDEIYKQLMCAKQTQNIHLEIEVVEKLEEVYKALFKLDNARAILLDLAKEYLKGEKLAEVTDNQYGTGSSDYIAQAIMRYYGE